MRTARVRRISRREADELLSAGPVHPDRAALRHLLDQVAAPPRPEELAGRRAAVAAFVKAVRDPVPGPARPGRRRLALLSRAALVKLVIGVAVLLTGSAALAAGTGNLPAGVQHGAHELFAPLGVPVPDASGSHTPAPGPGGGSPSTSAAVPTGAGTGPAPASPVAVALCRAWDTGKNKHGKALDAASAEALAQAAGGTDKIEDYCAQVLGAAAGPPTTPDPGASPPHPGPPTDKPTHTPKGHGKPTTTHGH
jgi:hypothetical protein